jgi:hypothetical protein
MHPILKPNDPGVIQQQPTTNHQPERLLMDEPTYYDLLDEGTMRESSRGVWMRSIHYRKLVKAHQKLLENFKELSKKVEDLELSITWGSDPNRDD